ncbi:MAG: hypothetical protein HY747_11450 [Elusimicrobia bacterium]|nr:hypothetical protein [Elusimicrobiota bacterium]
MPKTKWTQWTVPLTNEPGTMAKITKTLATAKVNITAFTSDGAGDVAWFRFLTETDTNVRPTLEEAGYQVFETPAIEVELPNRPGELSRLAKILGDKGINIQTTYATACCCCDCGHIVLTVDQTEKAWPLLAKLCSNGKAKTPVCA